MCHSFVIVNSWGTQRPKFKTTNCHNFPSTLFLISYFILCYFNFYIGATLVYLLIVNILFTDSIETANKSAQKLYCSLPLFCGCKVEEVHCVSSLLLLILFLLSCSFLPFIIYVVSCVFTFCILVCQKTASCVWAECVGVRSLCSFPD